MLHCKGRNKKIHLEDHLEGEKMAIERKGRQKARYTSDTIISYHINVICEYHKSLIIKLLYWPLIS